MIENTIPLKQPKFLPMTKEELVDLGWQDFDILLISGDAYIDHPASATALLGRWLVFHGYKVAVITQPDWQNPQEMSKLGKPRLFVAISAGSMDSLLANYTAFRKKRTDDAYTPGGVAGSRPNRATLVYTTLVKQALPGVPVIIGGIEASLRRASHYDFWGNDLRRSILLDSKADMLLYGMGEKSILSVANMLSAASLIDSFTNLAVANRIPGSAYILPPSKTYDELEELPSHEAILAEPALLIKTTMKFEEQMLRQDMVLGQRSAGRLVVFEKPSTLLTTEEMDKLYSLPFTRKQHPSYSQTIPAVNMLSSSLTSHRGCGGGCSFCALASHQGRVIQSRSEESILQEVDHLIENAQGRSVNISDIGGPSSNMWQANCTSDPKQCKRTSCLFPRRCKNFSLDQMQQINMFHKVLDKPEVNQLRVSSGIRYDLAAEDNNYLSELVNNFVGGQLKIAPEHIVDKVLRLMRKPDLASWKNFLSKFSLLNKQSEKEQFIIPYLISAFPGCTDDDMQSLAEWLKRKNWKPQQIQCFIPTPGTIATAMFYAGVDTEGYSIYVARTDAERLRQHGYLLALLDSNKPFSKLVKDKFNMNNKNSAPRGSRGPSRDGEFSRDKKFSRGDRGPSRDGEFSRDKKFSRGDRGPSRDGEFSKDRKFSRGDRGPSRDGEFSKDRKFSRGDRGPSRDGEFSRDRKFSRGDRGPSRDGEFSRDRKFSRGDRGPSRDGEFSRDRKFSRGDRGPSRDGEFSKDKKFSRGDRGPSRDGEFSRDKKFSRGDRGPSRDGEFSKDRKFSRGDRGPSRDGEFSRDKKFSRGDRGFSKDKDFSKEKKSFGGSRGFSKSSKKDRYDKPSSKPANRGQRPTNKNK